MRIAVIILAAGVGKRFNKDGTTPKQYVTLLGKPVIYHTVKDILPHEENWILY